jgi:hypothetical protein
VWSIERNQHENRWQAGFLLGLFIGPIMGVTYSSTTSVDSRLHGISQQIDFYISVVFFYGLVKALPPLRFRLYG